LFRSDWFCDNGADEHHECDDRVAPPAVVAGGDVVPHAEEHPLGCEPSDCKQGDDQILSFLLCDEVSGAGETTGSGSPARAARRRASEAGDVPSLDFREGVKPAPRVWNKEGA